MDNKYNVLRLIIFFLCFTMFSCTSLLNNNKLLNKFIFNKIALDDGNVIVIYDRNTKPHYEEKDGVKLMKLYGAIVDFEIASKNIDQVLKRKVVGGKEIVNLIEIYYYPEKNTTTTIFQFVTSGNGKGPGNIGIAWSAGVNLDGDVFSQINQSINMPIKRETTAGNGCEIATDYAKKNLKNLPIPDDYSKVLNESMSNCSSFFGFAIYLDINQQNEPYFETFKSEISQEWHLITQK